VNLDVTVRAVRVLRVQIVLWTSGLIRADTVSGAVTGQTELRNAARNQQSWIGRTVRRVTGNASIGLHGRMLVNKWTLLVCMTLDTCGVGAGRQSCLFKFEPAVRVVAIAAFHCAFQHFVMEREIELVFRLTMTTETKLRLAISEQFQFGDTGLLCVCT